MKSPTSTVLPNTKDSIVLSLIDARGFAARWEFDVLWVALYKAFPVVCILHELLSYSIATFFALGSPFPPLLGFPAALPTLPFPKAIATVGLIDVRLTNPYPANWRIKFAVPFLDL